MENMNNQGKRPEQYKNSAKFAGYSIVGMIILLVIITLLGGCSTTQNTPKDCCKSTESVGASLTEEEVSQHDNNYCYPY